VGITFSHSIGGAVVSGYWTVPFVSLTVGYVGMWRTIWRTCSCASAGISTALVRITFSHSVGRMVFINGGYWTVSLSITVVHVGMWRTIGRTCRCVAGTSAAAAARTTAAAASASTVAAGISAAVAGITIAAGIFTAAAGVSAGITATAAGVCVAAGNGSAARGFIATTGISTAL
jgi:hypothetical protein